MQAEKGVAIGIINSSWGGTNIASWSTRQSLEKYARFREKLQSPQYFHPCLLYTSNSFIHFLALSSLDYQTSLESIRRSGGNKTGLDYCHARFHRRRICRDSLLYPNCTLCTCLLYTSGPILGLFAFGIFTKKQVYDKYIPLVAIASPILCYILQRNSEAWFNGYQISYELLLFNAAFTFIGLCFLIRKKSTMDNTTVL